jgi:hypothetical protein
MSFLLLIMSTLQQNWRIGQTAWKQGGGGEKRGGRGQGGEMAQTMYAYMNK